MDIWTLTGILLVGFSLVLRRLLRHSRPAGLPPGPAGYPIIGNLAQIPPDKPHVQFKKWAEEYGPIYSLALGSRTMIVLSSDQVVKDLLDKRGSIYSSRPTSYITSLANGDLNFTVMEYNATWKLTHRLFANALSPSACRSYIPYQDLENRQMLSDMLHKPSLYVSHIQRYTYSVMTQLVLGFRTTDISDPNLVELFSGFEEWSALMGQATSILVDLFPGLRSLPNVLLPARRKAQGIHANQLKLFLSHWKKIKKSAEANSARPCIGSSILAAQPKEEFSDELAAYTCGFLLVAGSETIATQMVVFIEAMILYQDVQKAAQDEIDRVCGDRMPTIDDDLPYVRACIKEVCRWLPAAILGVPHATTQDDEYMGYHIPKGAMVMLNVWAIHRDPNRYKDPDKFDPSRFLNDKKSARESALSTDVTERDHFLFGAGRRLCAGMDIAENALFLGMARMLWAFDITAGADEHGKQVIPNPDNIVVGLAAGPKPFPASIIARSQDRARAVDAQWQDAKAQLDNSMQWKRRVS